MFIRMIKLLIVSVLTIYLFQMSSGFPQTTPTQGIPISIQNATQFSASSVPGCNCGVFLSGQFTKGSNKPPLGYPPIAAEFNENFPCNSVGQKQCTNKCIENLAKYLAKSADIICASIDRDCFRERAYLFVKNCNNGWQNTNLSAGKEYCCKSGEFYKCPTTMV